MIDVPWREQIKQAMKAKGMTRSDMADRMTISVTTVSDWLAPKPRRKLTMHRARLLSLILGIDGLQLLLDYTEQEYRAAYLPLTLQKKTTEA